MKRYHLFLIILIVYSCDINRDYKSSISDPMLFQESVQNLTDIIVHDIFSPPVASRVYLYPTIAAYEFIAKFDTLNYNSMVGKLSGLEPIPNLSEKVNPYLASLYAFNSVGKALIFSEDKMKLFQEKQDKKIKRLKVPGQLGMLLKHMRNKSVSIFYLGLATIFTTKQELILNTLFNKRITIGNLLLQTIWME